MTAVLVTGPGDWKLIHHAPRSLGEGQVRLKVAGCGVCGTDLHTLAGENPTARLPITPGHEFVGTVVEIARDVRGLTVGTRVAVDPSRSCGHCRFCLSGHANVCPDKGGYGARYPGGFTAQTTVLASSCIPLPDGMRWRSAILAEPLACVLNGLGKIGSVAGVEALVLGAGTIGTLSAYTLSAQGANVTVVEPQNDRRRIASSVADVAVADPGDLDHERRWDVVVDATGVVSVMEQGAELLERRGTLLILGVAPPQMAMRISPSRVNWQEQSVLGSTSVNGHLPAAVALLRDAAGRLEPVVTDVVELTDYGRAVELVRSGSGMKVVVSCDVEEDV